MALKHDFLDFDYLDPLAESEFWLVFDHFGLGQSAALSGNSAFFCTSVLVQPEQRHVAFLGGRLAHQKP